MKGCAQEARQIGDCVMNADIPGSFSSHQNKAGKVPDPKGLIADPVEVDTPAIARLTERGGCHTFSLYAWHMRDRWPQTEQIKSKLPCFI